MKFFFAVCLCATLLFNLACSKKIYESNGERIYKTGRNERNEKMINRKLSRIKIVNSCKTCHGKNGAAMKSVSIRYSYLSNPVNFAVPYNDSLLFRFLDDGLKSDGKRANIGVIWKMPDKDKQDLIQYLKAL